MWTSSASGHEARPQLRKAGLAILAGRTTGKCTQEHYHRRLWIDQSAGRRTWPESEIRGAPVGRNPRVAGNSQGEANGDKCAWTFGAPLMSFSHGNEWKIQGEWSNAAYNAGTGYPNSSGQKGCLSGK